MIRPGAPFHPKALIQSATVVILILVGGGCASSGSVRELGDSEKAMFAALDERLEENDAFVRKTAGELGKLGADYLEIEFDLERKLTRAKLLEAMRTPWIAPPDDLIINQRAIVLYHFYELELAEEKVLDARIRERKAHTREILTAYRRLNALLKDAATNLEVVLENLNQPTDAQIRAFTSTFLAEVTAFREQLRKSDNPRLREMADDVERYEEAARKAAEDAENALQAILKLSE